MIPQPGSQAGGLFDEELAQSVTAPSPLVRLQRGQPEKMEGWVIALLVVGGGIAALLVVATVITMLIPNSPPTPEGELAANTPADQAAVEPTPSPEVERTPAADESDSPPEPCQSEPSAMPESSLVEATPPPPVEMRPKEPAPRTQPRPSGSLSRPAASTIWLSLGVALAQTLPTGTAMGFSVEYEFAGQPPTVPDTFFWVIVPGKGQTVRQPVQLNARGTLQGFVLQLRPEHGPFQTHIEDKSGNRLSKSLPLR